MVDEVKKVDVQNDWAKLREAVDSFGWISTDGKLDDHPINTVHTLVPKLLEAYAELWEHMDFTLSAIEQQKLATRTPAEIRPSGLVVPK